jgi:hypothetical protein
MSHKSSCPCTSTPHYIIHNKQKVELSCMWQKIITTWWWRLQISISMVARRCGDHCCNYLSNTHCGKSVGYLWIWWIAIWPWKGLINPFWHFQHHRKLVFSTITKPASSNNENPKIKFHYSQMMIIWWEMRKMANSGLQFNVGSELQQVWGYGTPHMNKTDCQRWQDAKQGRADMRSSWSGLEPLGIKGQCINHIPIVWSSRRPVKNRQTIILA